MPHSTSDGQLSVARRISQTFQARPSRPWPREPTSRAGALWLRRVTFPNDRGAVGLRSLLSCPISTRDAKTHWTPPLFPRGLSDACPHAPRRTQGRMNGGRHRDPKRQRCVKIPARPVVSLTIKRDVRLLRGSMSISGDLRIYSNADAIRSPGCVSISRVRCSEILVALLIFVVLKSIRRWLTDIL